MADEVPIGFTFEDAYISYEFEATTYHLIKDCKDGDAFIGSTSGGEVGLRASWNHQFKDMAHIARVYTTPNAQEATYMKNRLIQHCNSQNPNLLRNVVQGVYGSHSEQDTHVVYVAWIKKTNFEDAYHNSIKDEPISGGWNMAFDEIKTRINRYIKGCTNPNIYIGITSNGEKGLSKRWSGKYKNKGFEHIAWVYTTTSDDFRRHVEAALIEVYGRKPEGLLDNVVGGGGGPAGDPPYVVYVAWKCN